MGYEAGNFKPGSQKHSDTKWRHRIIGADPEKGLKCGGGEEDNDHAGGA